MTYDNQYNIVDISKDSTGPKKYFCNNCHRSLFLTDKDHSNICAPSAISFIIQTINS
jgi:hypothetical protein